MIESGAAFNALALVAITIVGLLALEIWDAMRGNK